MNCLVWNCRGTGAKGFPSLIKDMKREYGTSMIFLLETHADANLTKKQIRKTGFSGSYVVESNGQLGGIWCLWDPGAWKVTVFESST